MAWPQSAAIEMTDLITHTRYKQAEKIAVRDRKGGKKASNEKGESSTPMSARSINIRKRRRVSNRGVLVYSECEQPQIRIDT